VHASQSEIAEGRPGADERDRARVRDLIAWAWAGLDDDLLQPGLDPSGVLPLVAPDTREFYWEVHFEAGRPTRLDFLHRATLQRSARSFAACPDPVLEDLRRWYEQDEVAARFHPSVWLEVDGPLRGERPGWSQGVSVCLDRYIGTPRAHDVATLAVPAVRTLPLAESLWSACGASRYPSRPLERAIGAAVAHGGFVRHLSVMRGRQGCPGKVYASLPKSALREFLRDVGWPGSIEGANSLAALVCSESARVNLDLEMREEITERIGFELFGDPDASTDPRRGLPLERARSCELIGTAQVAALQRWASSEARCLGTDLWPSRLTRRLDLKFVLHAQHRLELKAYLGFAANQGIF